jgi:DNA-binding CsgD family transcriptional regulator
MLRRLTPGQAWTVQLSLNGLTYKQIAATTAASGPVVVSQIMRRARIRLGLRTTTQLIAVAVVAGMRPFDRTIEARVDLGSRLRS